MGRLNQLICLAIALLVSIPAWAKPPPTEKSAYKEAQSLYKKRRYPEAAKAFEAGWERYQKRHWLGNAALAWEAAHEDLRALQLYEAMDHNFHDRTTAAQRKAMSTLAAKLQSSHGRLTVAMRPALARVTVNSEPYTSPRWLPRGPALVRASHPGFKPKQQEVVIEAGQRTVLNITLDALPKPAVLVVNSAPPGATVIVDGLTLGHTPVRIETLVAGSHVVRLTSPRGVHQETVVLTAGSVRTLDIEFAPHTPPRPAPTVDKPLVEKWWFWTLIGVAVAGVATTTAILVSQDSDPSLEPAPAADWGVWGP